MITATLILLAAAALVALGIFIAANNPALAQRFKTEGSKALDKAEAEYQRLRKN